MLQQQKEHKEVGSKQISKVLPASLLGLQEYEFMDREDEHFLKEPSTGRTVCCFIIYYYYFFNRTLNYVIKKLCMGTNHIINSKDQESYTSGLIWVLFGTLFLDNICQDKFAFFLCCLGGIKKLDRKLNTLKVKPFVIGPMLLGNVMSCIRC